MAMKKHDCNNCKHAEISVGAYTNTIYIECKLEREAAEKMTLEELMFVFNHPKKYNFCKFSKGKPTNIGVTFDD